VFVPYGLPGERVRVRLTEQKRNFARAALVEVLNPSPDRITPAVDLPSCGGCDYAHMNYAAQLRAKESIVRDQFQRIAGVVNPPVQPAIASPQEWHYRNAVQFHLSPEGKLGFQEPGTNNVVQITECALCEPAINEILPMLDFEPVPGIDRIQVRAGAGGDILLAFESEDIYPPELSVDLPVSVVFLGPEDVPPIIMAGDDHLVMEVLERPYRVSAGSFFQVNTFQAENMLRYLLERLPIKPGTQMLEVYAGVGLFSAFLAKRVGRLVANESAPSAVDDFAVNLDEFDNVELYDGLAEDVLPALQITPDVALVDPPRAGIALSALDALVGMAPRTLAYVSCDPSTLARDAKRLIAAGYTLKSVQPFDMFPQTHHIESISLFER
jgi:23S rRNA (uracil1939-C5)-methyltransferase